MKMLVLIPLAFFALSHGGPAGAASHDASENAVRCMLEADAAGLANPEGAIILLELYRRRTGKINKEYGAPDRYLQAGVGAGTTPAYGRVSAHAEWQPAVFASLRLQYDHYRYYGTNTALLSFPSAQSAFGEEEVEAREGQEEAGTGTRFLFRPTLYAKAGRVLIRNRTDLAYFHFSGRGPYFLEWTYETLLRDGDHVIENRTDVLLEAWKGPGRARFLIGPYYESMHASSGLARNRAGGMLFWVPVDSTGPFRRPRLFAQAGVYLHDRNREGEAYAVLGTGFDLDL